MKLVDRRIRKSDAFTEFLKVLCDQRAVDLGGLSAGFEVGVFDERSDGIRKSAKQKIAEPSVDELADDPFFVTT